jgi:hypothetical protein
MLSLLAGAGRLLASGAGKKVADSASKRAEGTAGKKLSKDKFFNREEKRESDNIKTGMARPSISPTKLLPPSDIKDPPKKVDLSKGGEEGGIKDTFNKIDDTLNGIISSINRENQFRKKESEDSRKRAELENKKRQENKLERGGSGGIGPSIKLPGDGFGIGKFFKNILIGGLILAIMKNLQSIIEFFKKTYKQVKEFMEKLGEFLTPIWNGLKWIVGEGIKLVAKMLGIPAEDVDDKDILKNLNEISKKIPGLKQLFEGINKTIASLKGESYTAPEDSSSGLPRGVGEGAGGIAEGKPNFVPPKQIYDYLISKGVSDVHAKGMLANIQAESSFDAGAIGDNGTSGGLFQHHNERFAAMKSVAGSNWQENWKGQIDYALSEGDTKRYLANDFSSSEEASKWFTIYWERPSNKEAKAVARVGNLKNFDSFGGSSGQPTNTEPSSSPPSISPEQLTQIKDFDPNKKDYKTGDLAMKGGEVRKFDGMGWAAVDGPSAQALSPPAAPAAQIQAPAQSPAASSASAISESADYEMPGGVSGTMIMPMQSQGGSPTMSGGGGGGMMPVGISKKEVLNSLYQAQLVGFLYKQG